MTTLLVYATYSSGTLTAAELLVTEFAKKNMAITMVNAKDVPDIETLKPFDTIIFASPSWLNRDQEGMPHEFMLGLIDRLQGQTLPGKKMAVFGLGDTSYATFCGAVDHLVKLVKDLKGELVIDPLRIDGFYYEQPANEKLLLEWGNILLQKLST